MNYEQLKFRIALTLINGVGNSIARNLITYLGSEEAVFHEKKNVLLKIPGIGDTLASAIISRGDALERAEKEIEFIVKNKLEVHYYTDSTYPFRLRECPDAPLLLYSKCAVSLNANHILSIVGTRNATDYGKSLCRELIREISSIPSLIIVSGLAYGIDICAHKAALEVGIPTIGVVAHGLDQIYPGHHRSTAVHMLDNGGLVTEYISKTNPDKQNFVQRNRIIAGMSDAVLVVESGVKGGSLITAELGNDYNRDVYAFPGRTTDAWSKGCNKLIKSNKAAMVEHAEDLISALNWQIQIRPKADIQTSLFPVLTEIEAKIYKLLITYPEGLQVNSICLNLDIPFNDVSSSLLNLEFKSLVSCKPGGVYFHCI